MLQGRRLGRAVRTMLLLTLAAMVLTPPMALQAATAPGFRVTLLDRTRTYDSREQIGKRVMVVRFQASWCEPCVAESAAWSRLADRYRGRGVDVLALHVQDTAADVRRFMQTHRPTYLVGLDPKLAVGNRFGIKAPPATVVIDRRGEIVGRLRGVATVERAAKLIESALARERRRAEGALTRAGA